MRMLPPWIAEALPAKGAAQDPQCSLSPGIPIEEETRRVAGIWGSIKLEGSKFPASSRKWSLWGQDGQVTEGISTAVTAMNCQHQSNSKRPLCQADKDIINDNNDAEKPAHLHGLCENAPGQLSLQAVCQQELKDGPCAWHGLENPRSRSLFWSFSVFEMYMKN